MKKLRTKILLTVHQHHPEVDIDGNIYACTCGEYLSVQSAAVFMDHVVLQLLDMVDELEQENA